MTEPWLRAQWSAPRSVQAFTTLRHGAGRSQPPFDTFNLGNRYAADGDVPAAVEANRCELVERARLPSVPHWLRQVHGCGVHRVGATLTAPCAAADEPQADAAVTAVPGAVLAILTADCLPVLLCARDGREVGAAHAGWRGLADGVIEATVAAMSTPAHELLAWLGPAAGPAQYEVGVDVFDAFVAPDWGAASAFTSTRPGHWRVDLYALARRRLMSVGLPADAISGGDRCTIGEPDAFFSHRRDRRSGRIASLVWIDPA
ncbi:peptidoglycan editing factor PgeF [Cognatilysobacter bugurensis]|uniref:Purine nucleoside phosphorylase n=1 Tax=Cognatilysobacter bugurensis TaxID=543356 RepID=A0A918T0U1_9GAMM|nr:peptidoglycan editing factor PgeF [Lysobacter bugurensis]GHA80580.1 laccase domain protein [Lysobacter bugurensis]